LTATAESNIVGAARASRRPADPRRRRRRPRDGDTLVEKRIPIGQKPGAQPDRPPLAATLIATALGAGFLPVAPGTWGTAVAVPLAWALDRAGQWVYLAAIVVISVVGSIAADVYCNATGRHDNQQIVIDEVAGYLVTVAFVPRTPVNLLVGFVLFRLFDIWKPPPVRWVDRHVHGGFGVVADDLAAGVYGALVMALLHRSGWLLDLAHHLYG
jgi:phosphatidylglycerophosphatase A